MTHFSLYTIIAACGQTQSEMKSLAGVSDARSSTAMPEALVLFAPSTFRFLSECGCRHQTWGQSSCCLERASQKTTLRYVRLKNGFVDFQLADDSITALVQSPVRRESL
jgi:hypothetical protein